MEIASSLPASAPSSSDRDLALTIRIGGRPQLVSATGADASRALGLFLYGRFPEGASAGPLAATCDSRIVLGEAASFAAC